MNGLNYAIESLNVICKADHASLTGERFADTRSLD